MNGKKRIFLLVPLVHVMYRVGMITVRYDSDRMLRDAAALGWNALQWSKVAGVSASSVHRFLHGAQTAAMGLKLSTALGFAPLVYLRPAPSSAAHAHGTRPKRRARKPVLPRRRQAA